MNVFNCSSYYYCNLLCCLYTD